MAFYCQSTWFQLLRDTESVKRFKNLSICVDDAKGTPGKPYRGPATGIPWNKASREVVDFKFSVDLNDLL